MSNEEEDTLTPKPSSDLDQHEVERHDRKSWEEYKHEKGIKRGDGMPDNPDHGTYYYKAGHGGYKGHVRGMLRGMIIGALAGLALGLGLAALFTFAPGLITTAFHMSSFAMTAGVAGALVAAMTGVGSIVGAELMGKVGTSAGVAAAMYSEAELRMRYPALPEISPDSPAPGIGHHFEVPPDKDYHKIYHRKVAIPGLILGTAIGGLLAAGGIGFELLGTGGTAMLAEVGISIPAMTVAAGSLFGLSFGLNRGLLKSLFNWSDNLLQGRVTGPSKEMVARDQARYKVHDPNNPYVISGAQRDDEYHRLLNGYFKKSFSAGWDGDRRGFLGGVLGGTLGGAIVGIVAGIGTLALMGATGGAAAPLVIALFTALGARMGMGIFSEAMGQGAAFSSAKEIYNERIKAIRTTGHDISFDEAEKRVCERATHHPDMDPPEANTKTWFNWRRAAIGLTFGAIIGAVLTPVTFMGIEHVLGAAMHLGHGAATEITKAGMLSCLPLSTAVFSLTGFTFGMGTKTMERLGKFADKIFMGTFSPGHHVSDHISHDYPPMGPDSRLNQKGKQQAQATEQETVPEVITPPAPPTPEFIRDILAQKPAPQKPLAQDPSFAMRRDQAVPLQPLMSP